MTNLAQRFLEAGYGILPVAGVNAPTHDEGKVPLVTGGKRGASWYPSPLPTLPGGAYGLFCAPGTLIVDVDNKPDSDGFASLEDLPGYSESDLTTFTVRSPTGGLHLYFRGKGVSSANAALTGVDVRAEDSRFYTLGPGSKTQAGEYTVVLDRELAPIPDWLRKALCDAIRTRKKTGTPSLALASGKEPPDKVDLRRVAASWRKRGEKKAALASRLKLVLAGQPYEDPGARHDTTRDLIFHIALERPHLDPIKLRDQIFEPAWQGMFRADEPLAAREDFPKLWRGALNQIAADREERAKLRGDVVQQRIYAARWGMSAEPYSEEELGLMAEWLGVERKLLGHHLVCGAPDGRVWFLGLDREGHPTFRGPVKGTQVVPRARDLLAPFGGLASVEVFDEGKSRYVLVDSGTLLQNHGFTVGGVVGTFYGNSRVDWAEELMVERIAQYAAVEAEWCQEIDNWLRKLTGPAYEYVMDWIASCGDLSQAAPLLCIAGDNNVGKSLLALGLARLFGQGKPSNGNKLTQFNGSLRKCPIVEYEEYLNMSLDEFKAAVTSTSTEIESKGVDRAVVKGALRLFCSANSFQIFKSRKALTPADCAAIGDRVIMVQARMKAGELDKEQAVGWLNSGALERHMRWVVDNRVPEASARLGCRPYTEGLRGELLGTNEALQEAGQILFDAMGDTMALERCVFKSGDLLLIRASEITKPIAKWGAKRFNDALAVVGVERSVAFTEMVGDKDATRRYSVLSLNNFKSLCEYLDADWESLWDSDLPQKQVVLGGAKT